MYIYNAAPMHITVAHITFFHLQLLMSRHMIDAWKKYRTSNRYGKIQITYDGTRLT